jgi:TRAP-type mannitol/chloroaromatic compound transport system permease small subunit
VNLLLRISRWIDTFNAYIGKLAAWAVLFACLISSGNGIIRYALDMSSNAWLEIQWYLFSGIVLLGGAYVFKANEHVRVDVFYGMLPGKAKAWIDILGLLAFLLPSMYLLTELSWPLFVDSFIRQEMSSNTSGLIRWPVKLLMPLGFSMLAIQGISELIKRIAFVRGESSLDTRYERPLQ